MSFDKRLRQRLMGEFDTLRTEIAGMVELDKLQDKDLQDINQHILQVTSILKRNAVNRAKKQETTEVIGDAVNSLADTNQVLVLALQVPEPATVRAILANAPETNAQIAIKLLDSDTRKKWAGWLND